MATTLSYRQIIGLEASTPTTQDSTLLIIDAQNIIASGPMPARDVEKPRAAIAALLQKYRAAKGKVVHVIHDTSAWPIPPEEGLEFEELTPIEGEVKIPPKKFTNSFTGTGLAEELEKLGNKKLVIVGFMAHICVSTTARQASELGYDVVVVEDAVGDRDIPGVDAVQLVKVMLAEIGDFYGTVLHSSSIA
ncbi:Isochorismatase-like protein [Stachybotrys elegans]|uniref:Isochorismatase-like protein n=1 Tax=Stachybotrys elegans TaxID=80388 RepID=A0A8K0SKC8_9HYPO|nr:Isochorismatase-like protein [Stachybotrys elegans]